MLVIPIITHTSSFSAQSKLARYHPESYPTTPTKGGHPVRHSSHNNILRSIKQTHKTDTGPDLITEEAPT